MIDPELITRKLVSIVRDLGPLTQLAGKEQIAASVKAIREYTDKLPRA